MLREVCGAGEAVDKYGEPLPKESLDKCINSDEVLKRKYCLKRN
ncbi:MAG: hypothetical protein PUJ51_17020 [Clostridiales bacterium]|nr:hypothetical protein [Terrisporobacter sp.]MDD7756192.1 hypothetical protein [Clostridiales bacterium]MDY4136364.1 hypothetical protein [Terrisporobacter sp.]MDY4736942.1 hypothetical protein [Terrisporobacter sp.]